MAIKTPQAFLLRLQRRNFIKYSGAFTAAAISPHHARPKHIHNISFLLQRTCSRFNMPAMAGLILHGDTVEAQGVSGIRERGHTALATLHDQWHLGSDTKAMTATICAMLVTKGLLHWNSTLAEIFPEMAAAMNRAYRSVTLTQILTMRAGCPDESVLLPEWNRLETQRHHLIKVRENLTRWVLSRPPQAAPGSRFIYSNAGYVIAGHMAERVTAIAWEQLMKTHIFRPLNMPTAGFGAPGTPGKLDEPRGHTADGKPVHIGPGDDNPPVMGPAGRVHASIGDWAKFIALHLTMGRSHPGLLPHSAFVCLHTPVVGKSGQHPYAMGWGVADRSWAGGAALTHNGSNNMWYCTTWLAPKRNFATLVTCNQGGDQAAKACDAASAELIKYHLKL